MVEKLADQVIRSGAAASGVAAPGVAAPGAAAPGAARPHVALSGGVFQNRILFERVHAGLEAGGFRVLTHAKVPCNDGGLSLGQAVIAAARLLHHPSPH
jgi:hydrogenase maturation protein HypF